LGLIRCGGTTNSKENTIRYLIAVLFAALLIGHASAQSTPRTLKIEPVHKDKKAQSIAAKPEAKQSTVAPAPAPTPPPAPEPVQPVQPVTSCTSEIQKYDWSQTVALAVAKAESGLNPGIVNYNPSTFDYSVGCFQVNIWGANAYTRPSEAALKDPAVNVAFAYKIYSGNGHSFNGQWGVCRRGVACY
jgi:hypothetical protein